MNVSCKRQFRYLLLLGLMMFSSAAIFAQQGTVAGTVTDASGQPIIGANVFIEGTTHGTVSDVNGKFTLPGIPAGQVELSVSFIGYLTESQTVSVTPGGTATVTFVLIEDLQQLSEVVVIGYGTVKKSDLTGAISTLRPEDLTKLATTNVQQAMQGRVAGVMVTTNSGAPGDEVTVRIRGISTVNNSDPLYVVDGFPTTSISFLNPSDIETFQVLKDASATAIYGNRGSNGVILITTKRGSGQKSQVTFNTYIGNQSAAKKIPMLNAMEYAQAKYMAYDNVAEIRNRPTYRLTGSGSALDDTLQWVLNNNITGTNWQDEVLRTGHVQNYELGATGGSEKFTYTASGNYNKEDGIVINTWQKRYLMRFGGQAEINKRVKTQFNISYRNIDRVNYDRDLYGQGVLPNALVGDPVSPVYLPDTNWYAPVDLSQTWNPVAAAKRGLNNKTRIDQVVGNIGVDIEIIKGLVLSSKFGADVNWTRSKRYIGVYTIGAKDLSPQSSLDELFQRDFGWNNSNYINYSTSFGKHSMNLMVGQEWSSFSRYRMRYVVYDVPENPNLQYPHFGQFITVPSFNGDFSPYNRPAYTTSLSSVFGRVFYGYDNRYLVTMNIRRDGASQVAPEYRWGLFPSFSLGWNIKNETFMKNVTAISALKLRYGWGKTGNIGSLQDPYARFAVVSPNLNMVGPGDQVLQGAIPTSIPSMDLRWETVTQSNYAVDFGFLANKLNGSIDYFTKTTTDMIVTIDPPFYTGTVAAQGNYGEMKNSGIEVSFSYRNFDRKLKYEIGGNFTWLQHPTITKWASARNTGTVTKIQGVIRNEVDAELGQFYGYRTDGLLTQADIDNTYVVNDGVTTYTYPSNAWYWFPGQLKIVDLDGNGVIDEGDRTNIGSANPDFFYGFNINLMYKGFDFSMFWQGLYGAELINGLNAWAKFPDEGDNNLHRDVLNSWTEENQNTNIPRLVQGNLIQQTYFNDYLVEDASYLRLKNIQLGYTLPSNLTNKINIGNLRIYLSAENLLTITKYTGFDPEVGLIQYNNALGRNDPTTNGIDQATYPVARKYLVGLNVTF